MDNIETSVYSYKPWATISFHSPTYHYDKVMNKVSTAKNKPLSYNYIHVYHISNGFLYLIDNVRYMPFCK